MNPEPLVSIIIPTFNRANLLKETLDSIINQTYQNWECIIVDDGSTDGTDQIIANFFNIDSRIKYFNRPDTIKRGGNGARNFGFMQSIGDYIKWFDSDNLLEKNTLLREAKAIQESTADVILSSWRNFSSDNMLKIEDRIVSIRPSTGIEVLLASAKFSTHSETGSYSIKRSIICLSGLWNENIRLNQDGEFFVRVCLQAKTVCTINEVGVFSRRDNEDKITTNYTFEHYEHRLRSWCLIKAHLEAFDEKLSADYMKGYVNGMYFYLSNNYKWNLIQKYNYLFREKSRDMSKYKVYLKRTVNMLLRKMRSERRTSN